MMEFYVLVLNTVFIAIAAEPTWKGKSDESVGEYGDYFEGDMLLTEAQRKEIEDARMRDDDDEDNVPKNGLTYPYLRWPHKTVVYDIVEDDFNEEQKIMIEEGLQDIAEKSCVQFRKRKSEDEYAVIIQSKADTCYAEVGYIKTSKRKYQVLNLGKNCFLHGIIVHEVLHVIGFYHMQSTYDRDEYVTIMFENIEENQKPNFYKYNNRSVTAFGLPYDYGSVMHYGETAFSKNGEKTIIPKKEGVEIGQREGLSESDIIKVNRMYCPNQETTTKKETILDWNILDFLPKPNKYVS